MSSASDTISANMAKVVARNRPSRAAPQEELDLSDISPSDDSSPATSPKNKPVNMKKQKAHVEMGKVALDAGDDFDISDEDNHDQKDKPSSRKTINIPEQSTSKAMKVKEEPVTDDESDDAEAEQKATTKTAVVSKVKSSTTKKSAPKVKKDADVSDDTTPTVSDAEDEKPFKKAVPTVQPRKRHAPTTTKGGVVKKARLAASADSYDSLNKEDKLLFDIKTENPYATWKEVVAQFNLELQSESETSVNAIKKRWRKVEAAGTEIEHGDIQKMCEYKKESEKGFAKEREIALKKFEAEKWRSIASYVASSGGKTYDPAVLQRKYDVYQRNGRIDQNDNYTGWTQKGEDDEDNNEDDDEDDDEDEAGAEENADEDGEVEDGGIDDEDTNMSDAEV